MAQRKAMLSVQATPDIQNIRVASLFDQEYTVIPCVALCEGVLWPANAGSPELALAEEFGRFPAGWDGRPVVYNHPMINGAAVPASSPQVLTENAFGQLFNTRLDGKKLKTEIWINNSRVSFMSEDAQEVIADLQKPNNMVEVSTGLFTMSEQVAGSYDGQPFAAIWRNVVPDHLAILPRGVKGACSIEHGCGAPRTNSMQPVMRAAELNTQVHTPEVITSSSLIISTEVPCECPDITPEEKGMLKKFLEYARNLTSSGSVISKEPNTPIVPAEPAVNESTNIQENIMNEELVNGLIANEGTQLTEDDREWLSSLEEAQLTKLVPVTNSAPEAPAAPIESAEPVASAVAEPAVSNAPPVTTDSYIAAAPDEIRQVLNSGLRMHRDRKDALVAALKANSRCKFTDAQLQAKDIDELENITALATDISYEGQGTTLTANTGADDNAAPPAPEIFSRNNQGKE